MHLCGHLGQRKADKGDAAWLATKLSGNLSTAGAAGQGEGATCQPSCIALVTADSCMRLPDRRRCVRRGVGGVRRAVSVPGPRGAARGFHTCLLTHRAPTPTTTTTQHHPNINTLATTTAQTCKSKSKSKSTTTPTQADAHHALGPRIRPNPSVHQYFGKGYESMIHLLIGKSLRTRVWFNVLLYL